MAADLPHKKHVRLHSTCIWLEAEAVVPVVWGMRCWRVIGDPWPRCRPVSVHREYAWCIGNGGLRGLAAPSRYNLRSEAMPYKSS